VTIVINTTPTAHKTKRITGTMEGVLQITEIEKSKNRSFPETAAS
jgi:hypothetical protein